MWWSKREPEPEPEMKPGDCECGHRRCSHEGGVGKCNSDITDHVIENSPELAKRFPDTRWGCACVFYIRDDDDDDGGPDPDPEPDPEVEELRKITGLH